MTTGENVWNRKIVNAILELFQHTHTHTHAETNIIKNILPVFPCSHCLYCFTMLGKTRIWTRKKMKRKKTTTHTHTATMANECKKQEQKQKAHISKNKCKANKQSCFIKVQCILCVSLCVLHWIWATSKCVLVYIFWTNLPCDVSYHTVHITTNSQHVFSLNVNTTRIRSAC